MIALWLLLSSASADTLRATVRIDDFGAHLVRATVLPGQTPSVANGPVEVLDAEGSVIARAPYPPLLSHRSVLTPEGNETAHMYVSYARVDIPWPEEAAQVFVEGRPLVQPTTKMGTGNGTGIAEAVIESGPTSSRLDLVFFSEGYPAGTEAQFADDVDRMVNHLLSLEPYSSYTSMFNVWRVFEPSDDADIDVSPTANAHDTPFECHYGCEGLDRLICCDEEAILEYVDLNVPFTDGVMLLVNNADHYGGSGGLTYSTSYVGTEGDQVAAHELGHTLIGLWDEYSYGIEGAAEDFISPNCAHEDEVLLPWQHWIGEDFPAVGSYQGCSFRNWVRPTPGHCMMQQLQDSFCPICQEAIVRALYRGLDGEIIQSAEPQIGDKVVTELGESVLFTPEVLGASDTLSFTWVLDGEVLSTDPEFRYEACSTSNGKLFLTVRDETDWVRTDPEGLLEQTVEWRIRSKKCGNCGCQTPTPSPAWAVWLLGALLLRRRP